MMQQGRKKPESEEETQNFPKRKQDQKPSTIQPFPKNKPP